MAWLALKRHLEARRKRVAGRQPDHTWQGGHTRASDLPETPFLAGNLEPTPAIREDKQADLLMGTPLWVAEGVLDHLALIVEIKSAFDTHSGGGEVTPGGSLSSGKEDAEGLDGFCLLV